MILTQIMQDQFNAIVIRKHFRVKLPDAIIAATALVHDLSLITRNYNDFKKIQSIEILNPFDI